MPKLDFVVSFFISVVSGALIYSNSFVRWIPYEVVGGLILLWVLGMWGMVVNGSSMDRGR